MKVSFFIPRFSVGGAETVMCAVAKKIGDRNGFEAYILVNQCDGELYDRLRSTVPVYALGASRLWRGVFRLMRHLRSHRPDVLIATLPGPIWLSFIANSLIGKKVRLIHRQANLVGSMFITEESHASLLKRAGDAALAVPLRDAESVVAVSNDVYKSLFSAGVPEKRLFRIPNPVDSASLDCLMLSSCGHRWLDAGRRVPCLVSAGRLAHQKGYDRLLMAIQRINEHHPCNAVILGDGPLRAELEAQVRDAGLVGRVDMPGIVDNPAVYFARADAFVLPSRWEGMPNVLLEAAASGAPLIATDCPGGSREILEALDGGRLVPPDSPEAMASAILDCVRQPDAFRVDPERVREIYGIDEIVDQYLRVIVGVGLA